MDVFEWLDDESIEKLKEDREPYEAPSSHYTPKPNDLGKLIWLSGKYAIPVFYSNKILLLLHKYVIVRHQFNVYNFYSLLPIIKIRGFVRYSFRERLLLLQHVATFSLGPILKQKLRINYCLFLQKQKVINMHYL